MLVWTCHKGDEQWNISYSNPLLVWTCHKRISDSMTSLPMSYSFALFCTLFFVYWYDNTWASQSSTFPGMIKCHKVGILIYCHLFKTKFPSSYNFFHIIIFISINFRAWNSIFNSWKQQVKKLCVSITQRN